MEITEQPEFQRSLPGELGSPVAKLVYFTIQTSDGITVGELQETLALKKITLLAVLQSLSSRDLITRRDGQWVITR